MKCLPFFHKYKIVRAIKGEDGDVKFPLTSLSYVCERCGKTKSKMVHGHFDIEDFEKKENRDGSFS